MSMTPTDQTVTKAPRRSLKPAAVFAAAGLMATVAWVGAHQTGDDVRTDKTRLEALDDRTVETAGRHSRELAAPPTSSDSGEPTSTEPTSAGPTTTGTGPLTTAPTTTDRNGVGTSGGSGRASGSYGPLLGQAGTATGPSRDQSPGGGDGTLWLPGTDAEAPITGPPAVLPDQPGESDPPSAEEWDAPSDLPEADPIPSIDDFDVDELGCPNLGLVPIGGYNEDPNSTYSYLYTYFRALAPAEWDSPELVCGHPLEPWRDLVIQRLVAGGADVGAIIIAADGTSIPMRLSAPEWTTYKFRYGGSATGINLIGYPVGRPRLGNVSVIRTTRGGLVFPQAGGVGLPVLGGAWDYWIAAGGPTGTTGLPTGVPESAAGPTGAITWQPGMASTGARQSFQNGWLFLPGVITDVDAAAQPADRYEWHPWSELPTDPPAVDYRGQIVKLGPTTWYVDLDGVRHWIPTSSAWMCAKWDLGATQYEVKSWELDAYPLGSEFVCADYKKK